MSKVKMAVFASGNGSNLQALMDAARACPDSPVEITMAVSDQKNARALERARTAGVDAVHISPKRAGGRAAFDAAAVQELEARGVQLIALAGFMRILGAEFVRRYENRILNIHPSLLPAFPGDARHSGRMGAWRQGDRRHGSSCGRGGRHGSDRRPMPRVDSFGRHVRNADGAHPCG